tara:strand:+ start:142 stop:768 length:627 start_codon:yes stop_codon:yes gene_type:complete
MATLSVGGQLVATNDTLSNGVQDNITRLGTVTTGTMNNTIGSSATFSGTAFPTGHVIQMKYKRHPVDGHHNLNSSSGWVSHGDEAYFKFTFTPKYATSTIMLDYFQPITHTSTGGGYGFFAFTKDGNRNGWGGGLSGYNDGYGHFWTGFSTYPGMYQACHGKLVYQNDSTTAFEVGLDVKHGSGAWYYAHIYCFCNMQVTEFAGNCSG